LEYHVLNNLIDNLTPINNIGYGCKSPARDQRTPSQSHSSGSYRETGMGGAERFHRYGWEPFATRLCTNPLECMNKKEYQEFLDRNWMIIDNYKFKVEEVRVDKNSVSASDYFAYDQSLEHLPKSLEPSEVFIDAAGFRSFFTYSDLMMECIREIIKKEKQSGVTPEKKEKPYEWLKRVKRKSKNPWNFTKPNFDLWENLFKDLVKIFIEIHTQKIDEMKKSV